MLVRKTHRRTVQPPLIKAIMAKKLKVIMHSNVITPKGTSTPSEEVCIHAIWKQFSSRFSEIYRVYSGNKTHKSNFWSEMQKITIKRPFKKKFKLLSKLSENYLLVHCITNLSRINEKLFMLSHQQGQIIDVKCENRIDQPFWLFFSQYWTCPRTGHW